MMEQNNPRVKWDKLLAWRIAQIGIEVDLSRPLMMPDIETYLEDGVDDHTTIYVPIRLSDGRTIFTEDLPLQWVRHRVGPFGAIFSVYGERLSPIVEGYCMPDFACDCGTGEIVYGPCEHFEEVERRSCEIINGAVLKQTDEILNAHKKRVRDWTAKRIDLSAIVRSSPKRRGLIYRSNKRL